jgi:hypothetical protein
MEESNNQVECHVLFNLRNIRGDESHGAVAGTDSYINGGAL